MEKSHVVVIAPGQCQWLSCQCSMVIKALRKAGIRTLMCADVQNVFEENVRYYQQK